MDNNRISMLYPQTFQVIIYLKLFKKSSLTINYLKGLRNLWFLSIDNNNLTNLHYNLFQDLTSLERLYIYDNQLERLDGRLWRNNRNLNIIYISGNKIYAIEPNFINNLTNLSRLNLLNNVCTNELFVGEGGNLEPTIVPALDTCFRNFRPPGPPFPPPPPPPGSVRRFHMVLDGELELTEM